MKEYIITLFSVCCVAAIIKTVSPENATKKHIEILCAICVMSTLVLPIFGVFSGFDAIESIFDDNAEFEGNYDEIYKSYLLEEGVDSAESAVSESLCKSLGVALGAIKVDLCVDDSGTQIISATATISGKAVATDPSEITLYIRETLGVNCEIVYEFIDE